MDASVIVAGLIDNSPTGRWAEKILESKQLYAPHLVMFETANVIRRSVLHKDISKETGALSYNNLLDLKINLVNFEALSERIWALVENVTCYDASYVALAELLKCDLATLDISLSKSSGPNCKFLTP